MNKKLLEMLQDKCKDFGLSAKVIEELAEQASKDTNEETSDEDLTKIADSYVSIAKMMQGEVTRKMQKRSSGSDRKDKDEDEQEKKDESKYDDEPAWFAAYRKEQDAKLAKLQSENDAMKAERAKADRGALIAATAKKLGIPESLMKRYHIDDDVDVEKDLTEYKQDLVNSKLLPKDSGGDKASKDAQLKSDAEEWVSSLPDINS